MPVVQAGMGGGLSRHELAAAVSEAGGLGTIAVAGAAAIRGELAAARALTDRPIAVNLLLPFARRDWFAAAAGADVVVTFWGKPKRRTPGVWMHQCGSVAEARSAHAEGADAVIVQGVEAGGHVRGSMSALQLLDRVKGALPADYPLLLAGGIAEESDVGEALAAGASAAVAGTRFLLAEESRAHPGYRQRLIEAEDTILTELFGAGWPGAPSRRRQRGNGAVAAWRPPWPGPESADQSPARPRRPLHAVGSPGADDPRPAPGQPAALAGRSDRRWPRDAARRGGALRGPDGGPHRRRQARGGSGPRPDAVSGVPPWRKGR